MNRILLLSNSLSSYHFSNSYFSHNLLYPMAPFFPTRYHDNIVQSGTLLWSHIFSAWHRHNNYSLTFYKTTLKKTKNLQYSVVNGISNNVSVLYRYIWGSSLRLDAWLLFVVLLFAAMLFSYPLCKPSEMKVSQSRLTLCDPMDYTVQRILKDRIIEWVAISISRNLPNPGIEPRYPTLQADSLPSEPQGSPKLEMEKINI